MTGSNLEFSLENRLVKPGFELDRNAPEQGSGSFFKNRNGVPVHFFLKIPNENQIAVVAYTQVCFLRGSFETKIRY